MSADFLVMDFLVHQTQPPLPRKKATQATLVELTDRDGAALFIAIGLPDAPVWLREVPCGSGMKPASVHLVETICLRIVPSICPYVALGLAAWWIMRARTERKYALRVLATSRRARRRDISWQTPKRRYHPQVRPPPHACARA